MGRFHLHLEQDQQRNSQRPFGERPSSPEELRSIPEHVGRRKRLFILAVVALFVAGLASAYLLRRLAPTLRHYIGL